MAAGKIKDKVKFYGIKDEIRIIGIDDAAFEFKGGGKAMIVGVVMRGGKWVDGILRSEVQVDGIDATPVVVEMITKSKFKDARIIMLDGLGFAGFNLVDIDELYKKTGLPVIAVSRKTPDFKAIDEVIKFLPHKDYLQECIRKAGDMKRVETRKEQYVHIQFHGITYEDARKIVQIASTRSNIPEPLRLAHIISSGIALGESSGQA